MVGPSQLAPHRLYVYVLARYLTPPKGVWEGPRALIHLPRNTRCRLLFPPPCAFLASWPCTWELCLPSCWGIGSPSLPLPPRKGDHRVGAQKPTTTCVKDSLHSLDKNFGVDFVVNLEQGQICPLKRKLLEGSLCFELLIAWSVAGAQLGYRMSDKIQLRARRAQGSCLWPCYPIEKKSEVVHTVHPSSPPAGSCHA
eukprot:scaffold149_cov146-Isochrysis_galbana.AAC.3